MKFQIVKFWVIFCMDHGVVEIVYFNSMCRLDETGHNVLRISVPVKPRYQWCEIAVREMRIS